jgi:hypothetical protein
MSKRKTILLGVIVALLLIAVAGGVYFYLNRGLSKEKGNSNKQSGTNPSSSTSNLGNNTNGSSSKTPCPAATLTSDETLNIAGWKTFENSTYSFKYPETWTLVANQANFVNFRDTEANINLEVRSGSKIDDSKYSTGYAQESIKDITVNCRNARRDHINSSPTNHAIYVPIFKEGSTSEKEYTVSMDFDYVGASISGDIIDAFDTLLKTLTFK